MIQEIAAADRRRLQEISDAAALVEQTQEALKSQRLQLQQMQKELSDTQADMDKKSKEADALFRRVGLAARCGMDRAGRGDDAVFQHHAADAYRGKYVRVFFHSLSPVLFCGPPEPADRGIGFIVSQND